MQIQKKALLGLIATGAAGSVASVSNAQPFLVNISGATLQQAYFEAFASTNDFLDVDANGVSTQIDPLDPGIQLAPYDVTAPFNSGQYWQVQYRAVGSGNGLEELVAWGNTWAIGADGVEISSGSAAPALNNRTPYRTGGGLTGDFNINNPGAAPVRSLQDGTFTVTTSTGAGTGIQVDIAPLDVPVEWFVTQPGVGNPVPFPTATGYGNNERIATNKDGTSAGQSNKLADLGALNLNLGSPDANTVYSTAISLAPVAAMTNFGTGLQQIDESSLRHLFATGRLINGENLVAVTRDSGSGTRNAFANGIVLDPSYSVGENIGLRNSSSTFDILGPNFLPSNKGSSSRLDQTVRNHRLAIGSSGAERGVSSGWLSAGQAEVLAVRADLKGGTEYSRPTIDNVLDNDANGYTIVGAAVFATIGDPRNETMIGGEPGNTNPAPDNAAAAAYINNATRAVAAFNSVPGGLITTFSPGEFLATQFLIPQASDFLLGFTDPSMLVPNPELNQAVQDFARTDPNNALGQAVYQSFNTTSAGQVPTRTALANTYSDQALVPGGGSYINQGGSTVGYGTTLALRNKIAGDFNGDGVRSAADAADMMAAYESRNGGAAWVAPDGVYGAGAGNDAIIEVLGDFNGDGNFDAQDVRYWADGLVLTADVLDRAAGFAAVDTNTAGGNFFGTSLATGAYDAGDSRADVSGPASLHTRGFQPIGQDGVVDAFDIDYVCMNFGDWSNLTDAVEIDLAADMNGDLVIDLEDVRVIVEDILDSQTGDVNLDGVVDATDVAIVTANQGTNGGYADGDLNCDGLIDADDLAIVNPCVTDFTGDGQTDGADLGVLLGAWGTPGADLTGDGNTDGADLGILLGAWGPC
jgi:hypothetical protein